MSSKTIYKCDICCKETNCKQLFSVRLTIEGSDMTGGDLLRIKKEEVCIPCREVISDIINSTFLNLEAGE